MFVKGFELDGVDAGGDQRGKLLMIGGAGFFPRDAAVGINADSQRPDRASDVDVIVFAFGNRQPREFNGAAILTVDVLGAAGGRQFEAIGAEGVGFDHVGAGGDVGLVNRDDHFGGFDVHGVKTGIGAGMGLLMEHRSHSAVAEDWAVLFQTVAEWHSGHGLSLRAYPTGYSVAEKRGDAPTLNPSPKMREGLAGAQAHQNEGGTSTAQGSPYIHRSPAIDSWGMDVLS